MAERRLLWIDTTGKPVITTTPNGERNARHWGWTPAMAVTDDALATHDRTVRAEAWDEGYDQAYRSHCDVHDEGGICDVTDPNPYRADEKEAGT